MICRVVAGQANISKRCATCFWWQAGICVRYRPSAIQQTTAWNVCHEHHSGNPFEDTDPEAA